MKKNMMFEKHPKISSRIPKLAQEFQISLAIPNKPKGQILAPKKQRLQLDEPNLKKNNDQL